MCRCVYSSNTYKNPREEWMPHEPHRSFGVTFSQAFDKGRAHNANMKIAAIQYLALLLFGQPPLQTSR